MKRPSDITPPNSDVPGGSALSAHQKERRRVLGLMAASAALAGGGGCSAPTDRHLVPYALGPEQLLPGVPVLYATALAERGYAIGALVEANDGRPTKVEGNPRHPASLGSTDAQMQAAVLQMWDPARSSILLGRGQPSIWPALQAALESQRAALERSAGAGLHLLMRPSTSPLLAAQLDRLRQRYPRMNIAVYDPLMREARLQGTALAFGRALEPVYHFDRARIVLTLDADFLQGCPESIRYARDLITQRNPDGADMSRLYALESTPGLIGALADHRLALRPDEIEQFAYRLAGAVEVPAPASTAPSPAPRWEQALLADLRAHRGACLVIAGDGMPPAVHALSHALNARLGTAGTTHAYLEPLAYHASAGTDSLESLRMLTDAARAGAVELLVILGGNPVYDAPADLRFDAALSRIPESLHLSAYVDETSAACTWHIPETHAFEHWSDLRAYDGTAGIVQPLIAPLYGGHSPHEVLDLLMPLQAAEALAQLQTLWRARAGASGFDSAWREWLRAGLIPGTASPIVDTPLQLATLPSPQLHAPAPPVAIARTPPEAAGPDSHPVQLIFAPDQSVRDGQWSNNAWLQELPRSMSKLTWGNAAYLSPRTAAQLGVQSGDELLLEQSTGSETPRQLRVGAWVLPEQPDDCITLPLGYGRTRAGPVGDGVGFDAYRLRTTAAPWYGTALARRAGTRWSPAQTQREPSLQGRDEILPLATLADYRRDPHFATASEDQRVPEHTLYAPYPYAGYKWAMTIDLNTCIGCNACTIACQAENNIPVVGPEQVQLGRVMHWIRIDRYQDDRVAATDALDPAGRARTRSLFQPVPCMQCEHAPCEEVCPVEATVHDEQGLNLQVYNRCIGTRFCSNNCPYKVRRFNFLQYSNQTVEALEALQNPDVTVRRRGVMEKCTYCLQRIERGRIAAELEHRGLRDGEVVTACQAACPTQAIRFGNLNDPQAQVRLTKASARNYSLLADLNTRPRTTYLARVRNPREA